MAGENPSSAVDAIESVSPGFDDWCAQRERELRVGGEFDVADMYRELRARDFCSNTFDCEVFDRGRTTALLKLIDSFPSHLTFYTEAGDELSANEARVLGGWLPKLRSHGR
jgi:hypothetical protein